MIKFSLLFFIPLIFGCGKALEEKSDDLHQEEVVADGIYSAILLPVNPRLSSDVHGDVRVTKYSDQLEISLNVKNAPMTRVKQALHTGEKCPTLNDDQNRDGYVHSAESFAVTGYIVLPLDNDLSSQRNGNNLTLSGSYRYKRSTSYYLMLSDLHLPDEVINDSIVKLNSQELSFNQKVVTLYSETSNGEIPIACGVLNKISEEPLPDSEWEERPDPYPEPRPRPRPRPQPRPQPEPEPEPEIGPETEQPESWWDRLRERWRRWRDRRRPVGAEHEIDG